MSVQFAVLASGSQGNATLVQCGGVGTLLDVGIGPRGLAHRLASVGSGWERIASVLLTHTHGDHVRNATMHRLARQRVVFYCHEAHRDELGIRPGFQELDRAGLVRHYDERPFLTATGLRIEPLELQHDSSPTFGFRVEAKVSRTARPVALGYVADMGCWTVGMVDALSEVDLLGVEFNHDVEMQRRAPRSPALIARNLGDWGHLSNAQGAEFVTAVLARSGPATLRHLVLLHLSEQCNHPALALTTARAAVRTRKRRTMLHAASQSRAYPNVLLAPARRRSPSSHTASLPLLAPDA